MKTVQIKNCPIIDHKNSCFDFVLVAAGSGSRTGGAIPKQYTRLMGEPVLVHSVQAVLSHPRLNTLVVVHPEGDEMKVTEILGECGIDLSSISLMAGGSERSESVISGLRAIANSKSQLVLIHDAARPGIRHSDIDKVIYALSENHGAAPALPVVDTLKRLAPDQRISTVDRTGLYRIQTPQGFRKDALTKILSDHSESATDEFSTAEENNLKLKLVEGAEHLSKLTYAEDFEKLERLMGARMIRTGLGYDVHALEDGDFVTLCGVQIPHDRRLKGHSDADVGWHALTDALVGAMAEGDIGDHFPPTDPQWKGAPSSTFLTHAADLLRSKNGKILNVDLTLICEAPKIKPHRLSMREKTARILGLDIDQVSVKATTTEQLGFEGRREGISAQAIATIEIPVASRQNSQSG